MVLFKNVNNWSSYGSNKVLTYGHTSFLPEIQVMKLIWGSGLKVQSKYCRLSKLFRATVISKSSLQIFVRQILVRTNIVLEQYSNNQRLWRATILEESWIIQETTSSHFNCTGGIKVDSVSKQLYSGNSWQKPTSSSQSVFLVSLREVTSFITGLAFCSGAPFILNVRRMGLFCEEYIV